jgi:hypothetical protein
MKPCRAIFINRQIFVEIHLVYGISTYTLTREKAEAEMIFQLRMGSGPWILLLARV